MKRVSLDQQIDELRRELRVREGLTKWGGFTVSQAQFCTGRHHAALRTLEWLRQHRDLIRERCPELFGDGARS